MYINHSVRNAKPTLKKREEGWWDRVWCMTLAPRRAVQKRKSRVFEFLKLAKETASGKQRDT
jgi:hypothetical protein